MVGIISVVIGAHFGGGDHFDGGDHFGGGTGPLAGLPWIPPHARALPGFTNSVGTNAQAHLLVMSLMDRYLP